LLQFNPKVISSKNKFISTRLKLKIKKSIKKKSSNLFSWDEGYLQFYWFRSREKILEFWFWSL